MQPPSVAQPTAPWAQAGAEEPDYLWGWRQLTSMRTALILLLPFGLAAEPKETPWDALMPRNWDPMKGFKGRNLQGLMDGDPKAQALMDELRAAWDKAPTVPEMDGRSIRIAGYVVPLEESKGELREFLLVPYFGACIHTPPPPANQIIHVKPREPAKGIRSMDTVWVNGTLHTLRTETFMGASSYRMDAQGIERYVEKPAAK